MKSTFFFLVIVAICTAVWIYHNHPEYVAKMGPEVGALAQQITGTSDEDETKPFVPPSPLPRQANWTWTTADGKTYNNVKITKVEADCVTILDSEGGARVDIASLPAEVQKQLNYDPAMARAAARRRATEMGYDKQHISDAKQVQSQKLAAMSQSQNFAAPAKTQADEAAKAAVKEQIAQLQADYQVQMGNAARAQAAFDAPANMYNYSPTPGVNPSAPVAHDYTNTAQKYRDAAELDLERIHNLELSL